MDNNDAPSEDMYSEYSRLGQSSSGYDSTPVADTNGKASSPQSEFYTYIPMPYVEDDENLLHEADWKEIIEGRNPVCSGDSQSVTTDLERYDIVDAMWSGDPQLKTIELQSNDGGTYPMKSVDPQLITVPNDNISLSDVNPSGNSENIVGCQDLSSFHEDTCHSTDGQPENTDELLESGKDTKNRKRKRPESEEEKREAKRLYARGYRKEKAKSLKTLNDEVEALKNQNTLKDKKIVDKDQMIADLQRQVKDKEVKIISLNEIVGNLQQQEIKNQTAEMDHKIAKMFPSHVVSGTYPNISPSQNVINEKELEEMIYQAIHQAMDPEIFLKFMNDWLLKKGMSEIRLSNERSDCLPRLWGEEKFNKTHIIKTYRKIKNVKICLEQIRQDCECNGLA